MEYINSYLKLTNAADEILNQATGSSRRVSGESLVNRPDKDRDGLKFDDMDPESLATGYMTSIKDIFSEEEELERMREYLAEMDMTIEERPEEFEQRPRRRFEGSAGIGEAPDSLSPGYPEELTQKEIELIIEREAIAREMDPSVAIAIFRSEGAGNYQSQIPREGEGSVGGKEASYGPYQLYIGGGLGNEYEEATGRSLVSDNTPEGIIKQIQFALDKAAEGGWSPWYGRKTAGVGVNQGLENAKPLYNWKDEEYAYDDESL